MRTLYSPLKMLFPLVVLLLAGRAGAGETDQVPSSPPLRFSAALLHPLPPLPPAWRIADPAPARTPIGPDTPTLSPLDARLGEQPGQGWDGAEGDSLWLRRPGERLETEVAFTQALDSLMPDPGSDSFLRLGMGAFGDEQALAMGWFRPLRDNTLLNFSLISEPDLGEKGARGGILIHW